MSKELKVQENNPQSLIELAIKQGSDIEQLEKLMDLQERWEKKEARKAYYNAMAAFQSKKPKIKKTKKVSFVSKKTQSKTEYSFAPLPQIQKQIDPILTQYGLSYSFKTTEENNKLNVACVVTHEFGYHEEFKMSAPNDTTGNKNAIQSIGSTNSYLQRYTLCNAFGISADQDNDGHSAPQKPAKQLSEKDLKVLKGKLATLTTSKELKNLWNDNPQFKLSKEANRLFTERQMQIQK